MVLKNNIDNPISSEWKRRYSEQPEDIRNQLDEFDHANPKEYQLRVIKKSKTKPIEGDIFVLSPRENIYFYGRVLKTDIEHITKDNFVEGKNVIFIFKCKTEKISMDGFLLNYNNLLITPAIVDISYWKKGYFFTVGNIQITEGERKLDYGFYNIGINSGWYCKEDGTELLKKPNIVGIYGISTIIGIANEIERELIINPSLLEFK